MSSIKSVDEILNISDSYKSPDKMAYKYIIKQVDKLIRSRAIEQEIDAAFQVPAVVMFQPYFNRERVTKKIAQHYESIGFGCKTTEKFTINITWRKDDNQQNDEQQHHVEEESDESQHTNQDEDEDSSSEDELPTRKIVVKKPESFTSLSKRVAEMKKKINK